MKDHDRFTVFSGLFQKRMILLAVRLVKAENAFVKGQAESFAAVAAHIVAHAAEIGQNPPRHAPKTAKRGKIKVEYGVAIR